ncbi:MAG: hypothetical protein ACNS60_14890 [Candidatus Cyclobacteriaceae bacterium M2_1C_046]
MKIKASQDEGKAEKLLKEFGHKIDEFVVELKGFSEELVEEFNEKYEQLYHASEDLKEEISSKKRWEEVEERLKNAREELTKALKAATSKRKNKKSVWGL